MPALENMTAADVAIVVLLGLLAAWGWARGVPRRVASILATFLAIALAAQVRNPIGAYLGSNWTDTPRAYGYMVAFSIVLLLLLGAVAYFVEWRMAGYVLFRRAPRLEGLLGAVLAIAQGLVLLGAVALTVDPYFEGDGAGAGTIAEFGPYRGIWGFLQGSLAMGFVRDGVVPTLIGPVRDYLPADLTSAFPDTSRASGPSPAPSAAPSPMPSVGPSASPG